MEEKFEWKENLSPKKWNSILLSMNGHPLQSAMWGDSKRVTAGVEDIRWVAYKDDKPIYLIRFEIRSYFNMVKVAWAPKGPIIVSSSKFSLMLHEEFLRRLRRHGFLFYISNPWVPLKNNLLGPHECTIWVDLTSGIENIWNGLTKKFRYEIRYAKKNDVSIEKFNTKEHIKIFYNLYKSISINKRFVMYGSASLMGALMDNMDRYLECCLFAAYRKGNYCGGAFVIRCGSNVHYMWGAVDRMYSKFCIGEALQWGIVEWAIHNKCKLYDLEGIDLREKYGTSYFKKKLGGEIIRMPKKNIYLVNKTLNKFFHILKINKLFDFFIK